MTTHNTQREVEELRKALSDAQSFVQDIKNGPTLYFGDHTGRTSQHSDSQLDALIDQIGRTFAILDGLTLPSVDEEFVLAARELRNVARWSDQKDKLAAFDKADAALASVEGNAERRNCTDDHGDGDDENENCTCSCHNAVPAVKGEAVADSDVEAAIKAFVAAYEATGKRVTCWQFTDADRAGIRAILLSKCAPRVDVRQLMRDYLGEWAPDKLGDHHVAAMTAALAKQSIPTAEVEKENHENR